MHALFENIKLDELQVGKYAYDFELDDEWLKTVETTELLSIRVTVHADLTLRERDIDLSMQVKGLARVTCDRCLDPLDIPVDIDEDEVDTDELRILNLAWLAYELVVTQIPMAHCHDEGHCNPEMEKILNNYKL